MTRTLSAGIAGINCRIEIDNQTDFEEISALYHDVVVSNNASTEG